MFRYRDFLGLQKKKKHKDFFGCCTFHQLKSMFNNIIAIYCWFGILFGYAKNTGVFSKNFEVGIFSGYKT